jgi:hypothetical protein
MSRPPLPQFNPPPPRNTLLDEFNAPPGRPPGDLRVVGRTYSAFALLGAGLGVGAWLLYLIHSALFRPEKLGFLARLSELKTDELSATTPWGAIGVPPVVVTLLAYLLLVFFASIAGKLAVALLKQGVSLLRAERPAADDGGDDDAGDASP